MPDLRQHPRKEAERREGISLETVPTLEHGIGAHRLRIHHRRKIHWKPSVEGCSEEIDGGRPLAKKLTKGLGAKGPLGADDLALAAQGVGEDIQPAWNELGQELNLRGLAQAEH